jgi:hypothetical protein
MIRTNGMGKIQSYFLPNLLKEIIICGRRCMNRLIFWFRGRFIVQITSGKEQRQNKNGNKILGFV